MKSFLLRPALLLALLAGLSACGGKASFEVGGTISGLKYPGLELNDGKSSIFPTADGHFGFPNHISYADAYRITLKTQPAHQSCIFRNNTDATGLASFDTAGRLATINDFIECAVNSHSVGGTVSGLTAGQVELANGSLYSPVVVTSTDTLQSYAFAGVPYDAVYGLTVLTQPEGLKCSFSGNSTGKMGDTDITTLNLVCVPK
jgi:hypothetical protein